MQVQWQDSTKLYSWVISGPRAEENLCRGKSYPYSDEVTADFFSIVAWRNTAEFVSKYFTKGRAIVVVGSLQTRNWTDQNGQKHYITEIVADECYFAGNSANGNGQNEGGTFYGAEPAAQNMGTKPAATFEELSTEDDLPF